MTDDTTVSKLREVVDLLDKYIHELSKKNPIFGFISQKHVKCGKKNCKCIRGDRFLHGPYFYLRQEPDYSYKKYLGKKIPTEIEERINVGKEIKKLEKKRKKIDNLLTKLI